MMFSTLDGSMLQERLEKIRMYLNMSREQFLSILNIKEDELQLITEGKKNFTAEMVLILHREYDISIKWLHEGIGEMRVFNKENRLRLFKKNVAKLNENRELIVGSKREGNATQNKKSINTRALEKELIALEDKIEDTMYPIRRTLLRTAQHNTFDEHQNLRNALRELRKRVHSADHDVTSWTLDLQRLKQKVSEETTILLRKLEAVYEQRTTQNINMETEENSFQDAWRVHKSSV